MFFLPLLVLLPVGLLTLSYPAFAAEAETASAHSLLSHPGSILCLVIFLAAYIAVLLEEKTDMRKSKPVLLGAGLIWIIIALIVKKSDISSEALHHAVNRSLEEYGSLMLFLLAAMTYISTMEERRVFETLRAKLVSMGLNMRQIFWATGILAFFISPFADNLTTALIMGAVIMAVGGNDNRFISLACINVVCAANAGGAFSPFGDITTLMVWQAGKIPFFDFLALFIPSVVCFLVPAVIMSWFVPQTYPDSIGQSAHMKRGGRATIFMGLGTIALAVTFEQILHLPAFLGMMTGLSFLMMYMWYLRRKDPTDQFDIVEQIAESEWDTLLFFFGIIFCVSGLAFIGYLDFLSNAMYGHWGAGTTNIAMGFISAFIDNIPVMFAILTMNPDMNEFQWLLITLTTGIGGSMLSIGSAAGVGLMGVAHGHYTFLSHLKWTPVIIAGYLAAIAVHYLING